MAYPRKNLKKSKNESKNHDSENQNQKPLDKILSKLSQHDNFFGLIDIKKLHTILIKNPSFSLILKINFSHFAIYSDKDHVYILDFSRNSSKSKKLLSFLHNLNKKIEYTQHQSTSSEFSLLLAHCFVYFMHKGLSYLKTVRKLKLFRCITNILKHF